ncbi:MAG: transketolase [Rickettsiales bacterium]|jgi:transketolase|nr:transketolase [Rickettsiales bacterium]
MTDTQKLANAVRMLAVDMVAKANSGHPGLPLGFADVATILFTEFLKFDAKNPKWYDRDRFVLSAGHGSALLYSLLHLTGYEDCAIDDLKNFRQLHSKCAGHPEYGYLEGIETTTGPLGAGVSNAVGFALSEKMAKARFGEKLVNHKVYCMVGDGCLMEGISYEALGLAGTLNLNNLVILWDDNEITIDGNTSITRKEDMKLRFESIGFKVLSADGHNYESIRKALKESQTSTQPTFIAFKTTIGLNSPKQGTSKVHGSPIKDADLAETKAKFNWTSAPFEIPADIVAAWKNAGSRGNVEYKKWNAEAKSKEFIDFLEGNLGDTWKGALAKFKEEISAEKPKEATRKSSGRVLEVLTAAIPNLIAGTADLTGSVLTQTTTTKQVINKNDFSGRYIEYGIREHAMAGIMNGIKLDGGFIPYEGSFFCFLDYMKAQFRLAAIMGLPVIHVLTHDSIGVGEDGPTHQPVEHLATLRSTPNINVFRPCDLQETIECYEIALEETKTPSALVFSRQDVIFNSKPSKENNSKKGFYIFDDTNGEPEVVIIATGTEVGLAVDVKKALEGKVKVRIVSAPCWELFDKQTGEYKKSILGGEKTLKVAIEALSSFGWTKYIGDKGLFFGIPDNEFGVSAPATQIYDLFGLTTDKISAKILKTLGK